MRSGFGWSIVIATAVAAALLRCVDNGAGSDGPAPITEVTVDTSALSVPDSVTQFYTLPAYDVAVQILSAGGRPDSNAVLIPVGLVDSVRRAFLLMYAAHGLPARDSVVDLYPTLPRSQNLRTVATVLDTSVGWCKTLLTDSIVTDSAMRAMMSAYGLHASLATANAGGVLWPLTADTFVNTSNLAKLLPTIRGVLSAGVTVMPGGGPSVTFARKTGMWDMRYTLAWGDCPSSCLYEHTWEFDTYDRGLVRLIGSSGAGLASYQSP